MRLRLARICGTGDVLPNMQPFAVSDQNFLMLLIAVGCIVRAARRSPVSPSGDMPVSRQAYTILFQQCAQ